MWQENMKLTPFQLKTVSKYSQKNVYNFTNLTCAL